MPTNGHPTQDESAAALRRIDHAAALSMAMAADALVRETQDEPRLIAAREILDEIVAGDGEAIIASLDQTIDETFAALPVRDARSAQIARENLERLAARNLLLVEREAWRENARRDRGDVADIERDARLWASLTEEERETRRLENRASWEPYLEPTLQETLDAAGDEAERILEAEVERLEAERNGQRSEPEPLFTPDDLIYAYTRADAIRDGVLIDVSEMAKEAGFNWPVAITAGVLAVLNDIPRGFEHQSFDGRLWDVLWMASLAARGRHGQRVSPTHCNFKVILYHYENRERLPGDWRKTRIKYQSIKFLTGPGDDFEPVVTLLLPHED